MKLQDKAAQYCTAGSMCWADGMHFMSHEAFCLYLRRPCFGPVIQEMDVLMTEVLPSWLCSCVLSCADSEGFRVHCAWFPTLAQHGFPVAILQMISINGNLQTDTHVLEV